MDVYMVFTKEREDVATYYLIPFDIIYNIKCKTIC